MYHAFIVNPTAGSGFALQTMQRLEEILRQRSLAYRVFSTEYPGHATELAKQLAQDPEALEVISVGGDGTAFETASGLAGTEKPMGIIPAGTGNDFIKSAGIPKDPEQALETILKGKPVSVDMGRRNEGSFLNVCGTGFDVTVLDYAEKLKQKYRGLLPYFLGLLQAIAHYKPVHLKIQAEGLEEEGDYLICAIANGRYIGGGIPICPAAEITDQKLDLVLVKNVPRRRIPLYLPGLMMGKVLNFRITRHYRVDWISFQGKGLRVNVDGEILPLDRVDFPIRPGTLRLMI
ncbi:MAG: diacylglycerol kinase family lipid kinase [Clostridia bacterium]|nr:diacylglycerol kinase family lipid kinase [Clostridia bacterium]